MSYILSEENLNTILEKHIWWLNGIPDGQQADLRGANLRGANLREARLYGADLRGAKLHKANLCGAYLGEAKFFRANLSGAYLRGAKLFKADLRETDLRMADLRGADLYGADLRGADLRMANFYGSDLRGANLREANLYGVDLREANLYGAYLRGADLTGAHINYPIACPETGSFIGFKKANGLIVELQILDTAMRCSATSRKCRCSEAKVISITTLDGDSTDITEVFSDFDNNFIYKVGEIVKVENFDTNRWNECSSGIHFFITRDEAVNY